MNSLPQSSLVESVPDSIKDYIKLYPPQKCFLAGGALRDLLTDETPEDWDLFVYEHSLVSGQISGVNVDLIHDEKAQSIEDILETFHVDCVKIALFWDGNEWQLQTPVVLAGMLYLLKSKLIGKIHTTSYASTILIKVLTMIQKGWAVEPDQFSRLMIRVILESKEGADQITDRLALLASLTNVFKETKKRGISAYSKIFWDATQSKREAFKTNNSRTTRPVRTISRSGTRVVNRDDYTGATPTEVATVTPGPSPSRSPLGGLRLERQCPYGTPGCPSTDTQCNAADPRSCPCYWSHSAECQSANFQFRPVSSISYQAQRESTSFSPLTSILDGVLPLTTRYPAEQAPFIYYPPATPNYRNPSYADWTAFGDADIRIARPQSTSQPGQGHNSSQVADNRIEPIRRELWLDNENLGEIREEIAASDAFWDFEEVPEV